MPLFGTLDYVTCNCLEGYANTDFCKQSNEVSFAVGQQIFCYGTEKNVSLSSSQILVNKNSIPYSLFCVDVTFFSFGVSQFRNKEIISTSSLFSALNNLDNPYSVVKNRFNFVGKFFFFVFF